MHYSCSIKSDSLLPNADTVPKDAPNFIPGEKNPKSVICTLTKLPCSYLYDGIQPSGCKHCHSCDSW